MKIILRIGGSVLGSPPDPRKTSEYAQVLSEMADGGHRIGVVVGGGPLSRDYIGCAKVLGLPARYQDSVAIDVSRLNARIVSMKFGSPGPVPTSIDAMVSKLKSRKVVVMGGLKPGITTDTVAALLADVWWPDALIKASNQKGIYTADPETHKEARFLSSISYQGLRKILSRRHAPGIHSIVDPIAVERLSRSGHALTVLDGRDSANIIRAIGGDKIGTRVTR